MKTNLSRRHFLRTAAGATVTAPLILRSGLRGADAPSNHLRIAAIGCGGRASDNVLNKFVRELRDVRVVAACDCFEYKRDHFATQVNGFHGSKVCEPVADFRAVLERTDIDAVVISTQDHWHVPIAYAAILAGKAVYVEKPLSIAFRWSQKLRALAAEKRAVFQYGTQQRGDQDQFRRACELVRNGYIGEVREALAWCPGMAQQSHAAHEPPYGSTTPVAPPAGFDYDMWIGPAPLRPYTVDRCTSYGGYHIYDYALGFIAGWGAHPLDIVQWGMDLDHTGPTRVEGTGKLPPSGSLWNTAETYDVTYEYSGGLRVRLMTDSLAKPVVTQTQRVFHDHGTTFLGTDGWICVDRMGLYTSDPTLRRHEVGENEIRLMRATSQARNFVDAIRNGTPTISPLEAAIRSDTLSHLGDIAIRTGRTIQWDPEAETIVDDRDAEQMLDRPLRDEWNLFAS